MHVDRTTRAAGAAGPRSGFSAGLLHREVQTAARRAPQRLAVDGPAGGRTYGELLARAGALARRLSAEGVETDATVGLLGGRSVEGLVGMLAVLTAGGAWLPLDPALPVERLRSQLGDAAARWLLVTDDSGRRAAGCAPAGVRVIDIGAPPRTVPPMGGERGYGPASDLAAAYVIYTSGSTGRPKGVVVPHRAAVHHGRAVARAFGLAPGDRVLQLASWSFDVSVEEIFPTWLAGATVVLPPEGVQSGAELAALIAALEVTVVNLPATVWHRWVSRIEAEPPPPPLRLVVVGSESVRRERLAVWRRAVGGRVRWINAYGTSECAVTSTLFEPAAGEESSAGDGPVPIGRALGEARVAVVDPLADPCLRPLPAGREGELVIGGPGLARGYLGQPRLTAERFVPAPGGPAGERLYRTGDCARAQQDGLLELLGRRDRQVKVRGFRVELGEIEAALADAPGVVEAAVVPRRSGHGDLQLVAFHAPETPRGEALAEHLAATLPPYMVPAAFLGLPVLPRTAGGKVDRSVLDRAAVRGVADLAGDTPPRAPVEELLASWWCELLGVDTVGVEGHFFALGGHSLSAAELVVRTARRFRVPLEIRDLHACPTVARFAQRIEERLRAGRAVELPPLEPSAAGAEHVVSYSQELALSLDERLPLSGRAASNVLLAIRLGGRVVTEGFVWAFRQVVRRQEVVRTRFVQRPAGWAAVVDADLAGCDLAYVDLGALPPDRREEELQRRLRSEEAQPIGGDGQPLLRGRIFRFEPRRHVLVLVAHRTAADDESMGVLLRDLSRFYFYRVGGCPWLADLPVRFVDFARWQREVAAGGRLQRLVGYWRDALAGLPPVLHLVSGGRRPPVQSGRGRTVRRRVPADTAAALRQRAGRDGRSLFTLQLAALKLLVAGRSGRTDVAVGTPVGGRFGLSEVQEVAGPFSHLVVLRTDLSGDPTVDELLDRVRWTVLDARGHQEVPFALLLRELGITVERGHHPLVQVIFSSDVRYPPSPAPLDLVPIEVPATHLQGDLRLALLEAPEAMWATVVCNRDLFDREAVEELLTDYLELLRGIAERPDSRLSRFGAVGVA